MDDTHLLAWMFFLKEWPTFPIALSLVPLASCLLSLPGGLPWCLYVDHFLTTRALAWHTHLPSWYFQLGAPQTHPTPHSYHKELIILPLKLPLRLKAASLLCGVTIQPSLLSVKPDGIPSPAKLKKKSDCKNAAERYPGLWSRTLAVCVGIRGQVSEMLRLVIVCRPTANREGSCEGGTLTKPVDNYNWFHFLSSHTSARDLVGSQQN